MQSSRAQNQADTIQESTWLGLELKTYEVTHQFSSLNGLDLQLLCQTAMGADSNNKVNKRSGMHLT